MYRTVCIYFYVLYMCIAYGMQSTHCYAQCRGCAIMFSILQCMFYLIYPTLHYFIPLLVLALLSGPHSDLKQVAHYDSLPQALPVIDSCSTSSTSAGEVSVQYGIECVWLWFIPVCDITCYAIIQVALGQLTVLGYMEDHSMDLWPGSHLLSRRHRHHHSTLPASSSTEGHNSYLTPIPLKTVYIQKYQILLFASDLLHRGVANPVDMYKTRVSAMLCGRHVAATESTHNGSVSDKMTLTGETSGSNNNNNTTSKSNHSGADAITVSKKVQGKKTAITTRGTCICMYINYYIHIRIFSYISLIYYICIGIQQSAKVKHESIPSFEIYFNPRGHNSDQFMKTYFLDYDVGVTDTVTEDAAGGNKGERQVKFRSGYAYSISVCYECVLYK